MDNYYTFQNYIVGESNKFAYAAAKGVAANPSGCWNPLFIYGASGIGKTHLLYAIMHEIAETQPDLKICYIDCAPLISEIIEAKSKNETDAVYKKYLGTDVLLIDHMQSVGRIESAQNEFLLFVCTLYDAGKQIVLAGDRSPKKMTLLNNLPLSRFEWGLATEIQLPCWET